MKANVNILLFTDYPSRFVLCFLLRGFVVFLSLAMSNYIRVHVVSMLFDVCECYLYLCVDLCESL